MGYSNGCCQFWLKHPLGHSPLFMAQCASGDCLVVTPTGQEVERRFPPLVGGWLRVTLWVTFAVGVIVGYRLARWVDWIKGLRLIKWVSGWTFSRARGNWHRLASRALAFVNKRRLVSFAFNNYRTYSLRNTCTAQPTSLRRRRLAHQSRRANTASEPVSEGSGGLTRLNEGPVTPPRDLTQCPICWMWQIGQEQMAKCMMRSSPAWGHHPSYVTLPSFQGSLGIVLSMHCSW